MSEDAHNFDLDAVCRLLFLHRCSLKRIALQFPDKYLHLSVDVYKYIIRNLLNEEEDGCDVFIIGDST